MTTSENQPTFESILANFEPHIAEIARSARQQVIDLHPETVEVVYPGYNSTNFGVGPKKNSEAYAYVMAHKKHVNLGFYYGVSLPDPEGLLEGTGKKLRHVKIKSLDTLAHSAVSDLILAAVAERKTALGK